MAKSDKAAPGPAQAAHEARDERHAAKVWVTPFGLPVNMVSHARGVATVRPLHAPEDGSQDFQIAKDKLHSPEDTADARIVPGEDADTIQSGETGGAEQPAADTVAGEAAS